MVCPQWSKLSLLLSSFFFLISTAFGDFERAPIHYGKARPKNPIQQLRTKLETGKTKLTFEDNHGYLKSLLKHLNIPLSSQVLVYSKTSLQRYRISPRTPRAIYFNDDVYVGFCKNGDVLELSAADTAIGTAFYTLEQKETHVPRFVRHTEKCLICHGSSMTHDYPGHMVRSLYTDRSGQPAYRLGSVRVTHRTPIDQRWGGWYVTGTSGKQEHRGNIMLRSQFDDAPKDNATGTNLTDLREKFFTKNYPTPHSDLVALMVLDHQVEMHNHITRANLATRVALYQQQELDRIFKEKREGLSKSTRSRIESVCFPLVENLLFAEEAELNEPVSGTSNFAREFAARGPFDARGRSLRHFDLKKRLFRYPCSYLIYSDAFQQLPAEAKSCIYDRLWDVLTGRCHSDKFDHLSETDRLAIREILTATVKDLPEYWRQ